MTTNRPESIEIRLSRLEEIFTNIGESVIAQNEAISSLANNINTLAEQTNHNISLLAQQAAEDRAQAAEDRQQTAIDRQAWQTEIQRIWQYLLQQGGNGRHNG
ncbi:MAG: hypothetical protein PUP92_11510 [Rhizonema sp. PD38]|nr:hypothetical protein [Rhizonema sp. PD38]